MGILSSNSQRTSRAMVVVIAAGLIVLLSTLVCWLFVIPAMVKSRLAHEGEKRGVIVTVETAAVDLAGVSLGGVRLEGRGVVVDGVSARVHAPLWDMWQHGRAAVERVSLEGGSLTVELTSVGRGAAPDGTEGGGTSAASRPETVQLPPVTWKRVRLLVTRNKASLMAARRLNVVVEYPTARAELEEVTLDGGSFRLAVNRFSIEGDVANRQVSSLSGNGGVMTIPTDTQGIQAMVRRLGRPRAGSMREAEGATPPTRIIANAFSAELSELDIRYEATDGAETLASQVTASLNRSDSGVLHTEGSGLGTAGGTFRWDLSRDPSTRSITGRVMFEALPLAAALPLLPNLPWHRPEAAVLSGDLQLTVAGLANPIRFRGRLSGERLAFSSPRIAPTPVQVPAWTGSGEGMWDPLQRELVLEEGTLRLGAVTSRMRASARWGSGAWALRLRLNLPPVPCNKALSAIPSELLGELGNFEFSGTLSGHARVQVDSTNYADTITDLRVAESCRFDRVPVIADLRRLGSPFLHRVREPNGEWFEMMTGPGSGNWSGIHSVSPFLVHAVLSHEDASFFRHSGFAPWAIQEAVVKNLQAGRFAYGASTITMQLAKNLFLHREKNLARKVQEVLLTWWLEEALEKEKILELYLNVIEYGENVYGVRQAAWHYFGRDPSELSPAEAAFLATVLPSPKQFGRGSLSRSTVSKMKNLLNHMHRRGRIDADALQSGLQELQDFHFRGDHEGRALPRALVGTAARLPYQPEAAQEWLEESSPDPNEEEVWQDDLWLTEWD